MNLEVGKTYFTRVGNKVRITGAYPGYFEDVYGVCYFSSGLKNSTTPSDGDLMREVLEADTDPDMATLRYPALMRDVLNGKTAQVFRHGAWSDEPAKQALSSMALWQVGDPDWRLKPETLVVWAPVLRDSKGRLTVGPGYSSKLKAVSSAGVGLFLAEVLRIELSVDTFELINAAMVAG